MSTFDPTDRLYRREVRERLHGWIGEAYGTRVAFERATGLDPSLVTRCLNAKDPQLPSGTALAVITSETSLSLDYLLTGVGPKNRGELMPEKDLAKALRAYLLPVMKRRVGIPDDTLRSGAALLRDVARRMEAGVREDFGAGLLDSRLRRAKAKKEKTRVPEPALRRDGTDGVIRDGRRVSVGKVKRSKRIKN